MSESELRHSAIRTLPVIVALALLGLMATIARGEEPETVAGFFCGYGETSGGGALRRWHYCGGGIVTPSRFDHLFVTASAAIGEGESAAGGPDIEFTSARLGLEWHPELVYGPRLILGADYWRKTAIVPVEVLGVDVVGVEHGPGVSVGAEWAVRALGGPLVTTLAYEWSTKAPKPETGGLCVSAGVLEACASRTSVHGGHIDQWNVRARYKR